MSFRLRILLFTVALTFSFFSRAAKPGLCGEGLISDKECSSFVRDPDLGTVCAGYIDVRFTPGISNSEIKDLANSVGCVFHSVDACDSDDEKKIIKAYIFKLPVASGPAALKKAIKILRKSHSVKSAEPMHIPGQFVD